ncbi:MAG: hypothetical protein RMM98_10750 [Acidobacteriota bacterium]|nr:hypothetical protein [Blastocatellia bacterium]MDW8240085.1 hypothetical protein [Acidobacteriota bacterium]
MATIPKPKRTQAVKAWLKQELKEQQEKYKRIVAEMDALSPQREKWIAEFFERIQTRGFNVHWDNRRKIKPEEIPPKPKKKIRVVY